MSLELSLDQEGQLSGKGVETYSGFEAAQLAEALEALSTDQRDQALQSALALLRRGGPFQIAGRFSARRGSEGDGLLYEFLARRFARADGPGRLISGSLPTLSWWAVVSCRSQPSDSLFIESTEASSSRATLTLPRRAGAAQPTQGGEPPGRQGNISGRRSSSERR